MILRDLKELSRRPEMGGERDLYVMVSKRRYMRAASTIRQIPGGEKKLTRSMAASPIVAPMDNSPLSLRVERIFLVSNKYRIYPVFIEATDGCRENYILPICTTR
jgi:hypothetical protein